MLSNLITMKNILVLVLIAVCLAIPKACRQTQAPAVADTLISQPSTLIILVNDNTRSDTFLHPDASTLERLLFQYAPCGVQLLGCCVQTDSYRQEGFFSHPIKLDTLPRHRNPVIRRSEAAVNRQRMADALGQCRQTALKAQTELFQPKTHGRSDVANALRWANQVAHMPAYEHWQIIVVLVSDLKQDADENRLFEPIRPVRFPANTRIISIGADPTIDLSGLFPEQDVTELPNFQLLSTL